MVLSDINIGQAGDHIHFSLTRPVEFAAAGLAVAGTIFIARELFKKAPDSKTPIINPDSLQITDGDASELVNNPPLPHSPN